MEYVFTNDKPIYLQLLETLKLRIVSGELSPGSRLDSVRDLALQAKVNPNTIQKALTELERIGLVRTERTSGRFITDDNEMLQAMKLDIAQNEIFNFIEKMKSIGIEKNQIIEILEKGE